MKSNISKRGMSNDSANFKNILNDEYDEDRDSVSSQQIIELSEK